MIWYLMAAANAAPRLVSVAFVVDGQQNMENVAYYTDLLQQQISGKNIAGQDISLGFSNSHVFLGDNTMAGISRSLEQAQRNREIDIVVMTGPVGAKVAFEHGESRNGLLKPTIAPMIFEPVVQGLVDNWQQNSSNVRNFTFSAIPYQLINDVAEFSEILSFSHLAVVVDKNLTPTFEKSLFQYLNEHNEQISEVTMLTVENSAKGVLSEVGAGTTNYKGVYVTDLKQVSMLDEQILYTGLQTAKMPTFASNEQYLEYGALAALQNVNAQQYLDAHFVNAFTGYLGGQKLQSLNVWVVPEVSLSINQKVTEELNLWPNFQVLTEAKDIQDKLQENMNPSNMLLLSQRDTWQHQLTKMDQQLLAQKWYELRADYLPQMQASIQGWFIDHDQKVQPLQLNKQDDVWMSLQMEQVLWSSEILAQMKLNQTAQAISALNVDLLQNQMTQDALTMYWQLGFLEKQQEIHRVMIANLRKQKDMAKQQNSADTLFFIEQSINQHRKQLMMLEHQITQHIQNFQNLLSIDDSNPDFVLGPIPMELRKAELEVLAFLKNPQSFQQVIEVLGQISEKSNLDLQKNAIEQSWIEQDIARQKQNLWSPEIGFKAGLTQHLYRSPVSYYQDLATYNSFVDSVSADLELAPSTYYIDAAQYRNNTDWLIGGYVSLPVFNGLKRSSQIQSSTLSLEQKKIEAEAIQNQVITELQNVLSQCQSLYHSLNLLQENQVLIMEKYNQRLEAFQKSQISWKDVEELNQAYLDVQQEIIWHQSQLHMAFLSLLSGLDYLKYDLTTAQLVNDIRQYFQSKGYPVPKGE